ncbi:MAG: cytochrome d ubiquinol oxidase subunit II [Deltaproteobacteria bacterium RIFOXYA12_FULL_58_15]|nr:MAG: cytochrome d ubiquinol oxidase subunit II [Deltaproteobacteria bacterium RIFOXYA12_FULL_58_15]OGR14428.1 MAG: cytochrome d ubiquinol oxidase subunit II [Deltaproteobacteria bacterium RIFOXYB12_FULL_58_9]
MDWETLAIIWFLLLGFLLAGYAILDGFDLGVGILHPWVAQNDDERRLSMNAIGPLWDGNEVWLVTFGGAMFAAFPEAYATVFSGFYTAFILLLFALISRAVSIEFRGKVQSPRWRRFWDWSFSAGSGLATLLFGVAIGNAMVGIALDERGSFTGSLFDQLGPYPVMVGVLCLTMFATHGSLFLALKTEGEFQQRLRPWMWRAFFAFTAAYVLTTLYTLILVPRATANFAHFPIGAVVAVLNVLAIANIPRCLHRNKLKQAFVSSALVIAGLVALFGVALFPNLVTASNDPAFNVTLFTAASSPKTLTLMLVIAAIGMPFVLGYTGIIYWAFRGKVRLTETSY